MRILLKLSGESLGGASERGLAPEVLHRFAVEVKSATENGAEVAIVIGGGNIFRGVQGLAEGFQRVKGDQMGMLATVINSLAFSQVLESLGQPAEVFTSVPMGPIAEYYVVDNARNAMRDGKVAIVGGGTGNPYFTTDSAAALRACELQCDLFAKGTRVDGVYDRDPEKHADAVRFERLSYDEAYTRQLRVMDLTAFTLCREQGMPIVVFNINRPGALLRIANGEAEGTLIR